LEIYFIPFVAIWFHDSSQLCIGICTVEEPAISSTPYGLNLAKKELTSAKQHS
jgi:hypothetical protein